MSGFAASRARSSGSRLQAVYETDKWKAQAAKITAMLDRSRMVISRIEATPLSVIHSHRNDLHRRRTLYERREVLLGYVFPDRDDTTGGM